MHVSVNTINSFMIPPAVFVPEPIAALPKAYGCMLVG